MKLIIAVGFMLASSFAQAEKQVDIPVEVTTVQVEHHQQARWDVTRNIPHEQATDLVAAGEKAGGACHELSEEQMVVCFFSGGHSAGIDWKKLSEGLAQTK